MVLEGEGVKVLLKELERLCDNLDYELIKHDLSTADSDRRLINLKLRAEGARKLITDFTAHLNNIRVAALPASEEKSNVLPLARRSRK